MAGGGLAAAAAAAARLQSCPAVVADRTPSPASSCLDPHTQVRDKAKEIAVELAAWLGGGVLAGALLEKMPEAVRKDVEASIAALPGGKRKPERYTRREAEAMAASAGAGEEADDMEVDGGEGAAVAAEPEEEPVRWC